MATTDQLSFTISLEPVEEGWFMARVEEFPEVITAAPTREEARLMALDALREYLAAADAAGETGAETSVPRDHAQ
jgi:predicted RNase H-like HicB family nuclease